jgi:hypothetical protein
VADEVPIQQNNIPGGENYKKVESPLKKIVINNFIGGIAWSFGVLIGTGILFGIIIYFGRRIDFAPLLGKFMANIIQSALANYPK